jgi:hypothetical protein
MTAIAIKSFDGMYPVVNNRLLRDNAAQTSTNTKITGGSLKPFKGNTTIVAKRSAGNPVSIYRFGQSEAETQYWFEFTADADVIRGPIAGDIYERTYYTMSGQDPRMTTSQLVPGASVYPNGYRLLGVPPPASGPTLAVTGTATDTVAELRYYVYTFVSDLGEEGPPSVVGSISVLTGLSVVVSGMSTAATGGNRVVTKKRIYRTVTGTNATDFQFVVEIDASQTSYTDSKVSSQLGEVIPSAGWYPPRNFTDNEQGTIGASPYRLSGLTLMANGIAAGFAGNIVCFSEPYMLHAWNRDNEQVSDYQIIATKAFGQSLAVLTAAYPYLVQGSDPASMTMVKLEDLYSCASKRSVVAMNGGVVYASPIGLCQITNSGAQLLTKGLFTKEEWQVYNPSSMHAYQYDGRYFCFYDNGTPGCLVFSFNGQEPSLVLLNIAATAGFLEPLTNSLYLMVGSNIVKFDSASALTYTWKSKRFTLPRAETFGCAQVIAKTYPVTFTLNRFDTDSAAFVRTVSDSNVFRLPAAVRYQSLDVQVSGTAEVEQILLASSMDEMKQL